MEKVTSTRKEVATFLKVHPNTIGRLQKQGKIPFVRVGKSCRYEIAKVWDVLEKATK